MNAPRAPAILLAALVAGAGGRVFFDRPRAGHGNTAAPFAPEAAQKTAPALDAKHPAAPSLPRPDASAVLSASGPSRLRLLVAWLPGAGEEELLRMAPQLMPGPLEDNLPIRLLLARWAEVNPRAMLKWAESTHPVMPSGYMDNDQYVQYAILAWARVDFDAAWAAARSSHPACAGAALIGLSTTDPAKCLALLASDYSLLSLTASGESAGGLALARVAAWNPEAAAKLLEGKPADNMPVFAGTVALAWCKSDPAAAIAWMKTLPMEVLTTLTGPAEWIVAHAPQWVPALLEGQPPGKYRSTILAEDLKRVAAEDPAAARQKLNDLSDGPIRQYGRVLLMQAALKSGDLTAAREMADLTGWHMNTEWYPFYEEMITPGGPVASFSGANPAASFQDLMHQLAAGDPETAASILLAKGESITKGDPLLLAHSAAESNPAAIAAVLAARTEAPAGTAAFTTVMNAWAGRNPVEAAAWVDALAPDSSVKQAGMDSVFSMWAAADPPALLNWASQREGAASAAWDQIATQAPDFALGHLDQFLAANLPESAHALLDALTGKPVELAAVLRRLPDDWVVPITDPFREWLEASRGEATDWATALPPGPRKNEAAEVEAGWLSDQAHEFDAAFKWATTLPVGDERSQLVSRVTESLKEEEPEHAKAIIQASPLTPEEKKQSLHALNTPP